MMSKPCQVAPDLERLLEQARSAPPMTQEEWEDQRRSWVRAELGMGSDADEAAERAAYRAGLPV